MILSEESNCQPKPKKWWARMWTHAFFIAICFTHSHYIMMFPLPEMLRLCSSWKTPMHFFCHLTQYNFFWVFLDCQAEFITLSYCPGYFVYTSFKILFALLQLPICLLLETLRFCRTGTWSLSFHCIPNIQNKSDRDFIIYNIYNSNKSRIHSIKSQ